MKNAGTVFDHTPGSPNNGSSLEVSIYGHMPPAPNNACLQHFLDKKAIQLRTLCLNVAKCFYNTIL